MRSLNTPNHRKVGKQLILCLANVQRVTEAAEQCHEVVKNPRTHLEYCVVMVPHQAVDVRCLEQVQGAATEIVPGLKGLESGDRLKRLGLTTLETRRKRRDLIEMYKILSGKENVASNNIFELSDNVSLAAFRNKLKTFLFTV